MFRIKVRADFSGAHNLRGYKGKCEALHGHNWYVEVEAESRRLDKIGMVVDFGMLKKMLNDVLCEFDHKYLNEVDRFKKENPTSENIAKYVYDSLAKKNSKVKFTAVTVWDTESSAATYVPEE